VAWTGTELVGWGGGCCGDAFADGVAYAPARNAWRRLAPSPLAPSQHPVGRVDGAELVIVVGSRDPDGHPWPATLARAAAYDPATDRWRRIAPPPAERPGAVAVWDGDERCSSAGTTGTGSTLRARRPRLRPCGGRLAAARAHAGRPLRRQRASGRGAGSCSGGGSSQAGRYTMPGHGLAYDPAANRWKRAPAGPVLGRLDPIASWTGRSLLVWGGTDPYQAVRRRAELVSVPLTSPPDRS
jgi:hypothetical protein